MRILHLSSEQSWRGGEQQIAYLIEELESMGIEPLVACRSDSEFEKLCRRKGWKHHPLQMRNSLDWKSGIQLKKLCQKFEIDIVHAHSSHSHSTAFMSFVVGNRTPVILTRRVDFELKGNFFSKYKYTFSGLKKIACVSDAIREVVVAGIGCADHCVTIHSCIDYRKFQPYVGNNFLRCEYNISEDTTLIGNTSAIAPHKDYFTFVDSAKDYLENYDQKVMFFIIGKGEQKEAVYEYVTKLGIADHFIFTGFVENIEEVLPSLDIFLITSKTEGLGTSVIDAFASKVPVVATRAGGIPELVENMQTGLLSDIGDYTDLAKNLFRLKKERKLAGQLIENAFARAQDFNVRSMATRYLKIYKEILFNK